MVSMSTQPASPTCKLRPVLAAKPDADMQGQSEDPACKPCMQEARVAALATQTMNAICNERAGGVGLDMSESHLLIIEDLVQGLRLPIAHLHAQAMSACLCSTQPHTASRRTHCQSVTNPALRALVLSQQMSLQCGPHKACSTVQRVPS